MRKTFASIVLSFLTLLPISAFSGDYSHNPTEITILSNNVAVSISNVNETVAITSNTLAISDSNINVRIDVTSNALAVADSNQNVEISKKVASNELANITLGSEGIRRVGALGGYALDEFFEDTSLRGPSRDYTTFTYGLYPSSDLNVTNTGGDVYSPSEGYFHLSPGTKTLTDNSVNYAYWNNIPPNNIVKWTTTRPNVDSNVVLGVFVTSFGSLLEVDPPEAAGDFPLNTRAGASQIAPSLIVNGLVYSATGTALSNVFMEAGVEYHDMRSRKEHSSLNLSSSNVFLVAFGRTNTGVWVSTTTNVVPVGKWDNGSNIVDCVSTNWYKGLFLALQNSQRMLYVYPQAEYTNETDAIAGNDPTLPPGFTPYVPMCTEYVSQGSDTVLRVETKYWVDRRFQIRRPGTSSVSSGGSTAVPSLDRVMLEGSSLGGILPRDAGLPTLPSQLASKEYVDSTINNINARRVYVDGKSGNDITAQLESSILPFKTITNAIKTVGIVANQTNRYSVQLSSGTYIENVTMSNGVSLAGVDIPSTFIIGSVTFPPQYTDLTGAELGLLSVRNSNGPALILNAGDDNAYMGVRSCALYSDYTDETITNKSVVLIQRGLTEMYGTTYNELNILTTNGFVAKSQIFEHTTDPSNNGLSQFTSFNSSAIINCTDTNDDISMMLTHDNLDSGCINEMLGGNFNIHLDTDSSNIKHSNSIKLVSNEKAIGRSLSMANATRLYMDETNSCNLFIAYSKDGTGDNVAISRNNHIRVVSGSSSNIWLGAAVTTNDNIRIYDTEIIQNNAFNYYPKKYTVGGSAGDYYINTPHQNGDHILGGSLDLSALSTAGQTIPESGHVKMYANTYAGLENVMFQDSSGNIGRMARDNFFNGYNAETTTLVIGEAVYVTNGLSADQTPIIRRCDASNPSTMPCDGVVVQVGNIATGTVGRVMRTGRTESTFNTTAFVSGEKLYVPVKINGNSMVTNVPPNGSNIVQIIGKAHLVGVNGKITVFPSNPDTLGGRVPQDYTTYDKPIFSASQFMLTNSGSAKLSIENVPAGTTNTYILPSMGGVLATYTDIQILPVSAIVGETGGIIKGRVVYQSGSVGGRPQVKYADRTKPQNLPVIGVTSASGNLGDIIEVVGYGPVKNIDTSSFSVNDLMYLGTNGILMSQSGVSSDAAILMGTCIESDPVNGSMLVNIRSYYQDGAFSGSMRYAIQNSSTVSNATANFFALNNLQEAMRMGIRSTNHFLGQGSYLVSGANGNLVFGNLRRKGYVWNVDMTDSGDIYAHNNWPMMSLVPQAATSNAFLGIGTTNPLTMIDVRGSITSSNSFRASSNGYSANEHITYGSATNLIGILNTNLQGQITSNTNTAYNFSTNIQGQVNNNSNIVVGINTNLQNQIVANSNLAYSADTNLQGQITVNSNIVVGVNTNLQNQIVATSNVLYVADTNLSNRINIETNRAYAAETNLQGQITVNSNIVVGVNTNLQNQIVANSNITYSADTNLSNRINIETNRAISAETNLQGQVSSATNRIFNMEANTGNWNTAYSTIGNAVTNSWGFNEPLPTSTAPNDIYLSSTFWRARNWCNFRAVTEAGTASGVIFIRDVSVGVRTYTVVTNFTATTASTNAITLTGTIPSTYCIGVVITNTATGTNLWMSLSFSTTNGMKDL